MNTDVVSHNEDLIWMEIPSAPGYFATSDGRIWKRESDGVLRQLRLRESDGYKRAQIGNRVCLVHHLVLEAFEGPRPERHVGRHLNDVRGDNRAFNLKWGTESENVQDAIRNGRHRSGKPADELKAGKSTSFRLSSETKETISKLAKHLGVSRTAVIELAVRKLDRERDAE